MTLVNWNCRPDYIKASSAMWQEKYCMIFFNCIQIGTEFYSITSENNSSLNGYVNFNVLFILSLLLAFRSHLIAELSAVPHDSLDRAVISYIFI